MDIELKLLTNEEKTDIDETINEDPVEFMPTENDTTETFLNKMKIRFGRGYRYAISHINDIFKISNQGKDMPEYIQLQKINSEEENKYADYLLKRIRYLYPDFKYDDTNENFLKNFRVNDENVLEVKPKNGKIWYPITSNENKIPDSRKTQFGFSQEHIDRYNKAKNDLDIYYPDNEISMKNGFDIKIVDGIIEVFDNEVKKWYKISTKLGDEFHPKAFGKYTKRIETALGKSAIQKLEEISKKKQDIEDKQRHIYSNVKIVNEKIESDQSSISSYTSEIDGLDQVINRKKDQLNNMDLNSQEYEKLENDIKSLELSKKNLIDQNNDLNESINEQNQQRENLERQVNHLQEQNESLENEREAIEERLPLRDRVKQIIKRHGLTVTGIALAVGTIIGVIVSNLKAGLINVAKGVGNGLKILGKKLGEILPGMVGAIASFIFRTAGQVVGFLAKNTWLLIVAVVMYVVERYKK